MKRTNLKQHLGRTAALLCLLFCLGCGVSAASGLAAKQVQKNKSSGTVPVFTVAYTGDESGEPPQVWEDDGIVPFHEDLFPILTATPDPNRESFPVEERLIDGGTQVADFFVRDSSGSGVDLAAALEEAPSVGFRRDGSVEILIYHTHTSEAYLQSYTGFYYTDMETRSGNQEKNVVAAGEALKASLEAQGFGVVHDTTVNDETFNGSYARSWEVIQKNLEEHPGIQVTIDLHRDSMTTESGLKYKPTVTVGGRKAAQVMVLAGCDANGDWGDFPDWEQNLRLALRVQQRLTQQYPGLARPLDFSDSKYNMNATPGSMLIEVGTEVNTAAEAKYSGKLLGEALGGLFAELKPSEDS